MLSMSDKEMSIEQAAEILGLTPHELSVLLNKGVLPSRMHIRPDGKREKLLPTDAVHALHGTGAYRLLIRESAPTPPPAESAPPAPSAAPSPTPAAAPAPPSETPTAPAVTPEPASEVPQGGDALQVAILQSLAATQERVATIERRLESLLGTIATDTAVKLAALATRDELREATAQSSRELSGAIQPPTAELHRLTEALASASAGQSQTAQRHAEELALLRTGVAEIKATADGHNKGVDEKLADLFQVLEALPDILESQGEHLGRLVQWSAEEQEKSPLKHVQRIGKLIGDRRRGGKGEE